MAWKRHCRAPGICQNSGTVRAWRHGTLRTQRQFRDLNTLTYPALLVVDENGNVAVTQSAAILFFLLINRSYNRASMVLTSS